MRWGVIEKDGVFGAKSVFCWEESALRSDRDVVCMWIESKYTEYMDDNPKQ